MGWFLLLLVLVALAFGVLGIVIKATIVIVLTILFTIAALVMLSVLAFRHQANKFRRELERRNPS
jgi:heme A synthase